MWTIPVHDGDAAQPEVGPRSRLRRTPHHAADTHHGGTGEGRQHEGPKSRATPTLWRGGCRCSRRLCRRGHPVGGALGVMIVPVAMVARIIPDGRSALTGRVGRHSTAGLAVVAATSLVTAQLEESVGRGHPQL